MVELTTITDVDGPLPLSDVTLDQTTILTISYYYNGVFYEDAEVVDDPYDYQDIIDVVPGTTTPLPDWWDLLANIGEMAKWLQVTIYVALALIVILVVSFIFRIITLIRFVFKLIIWMIKIIYKVLKFIVIQIPKGIMGFIIFLVVPSNKRKERSNVSRYL
ncbi:MAG: hypothetical protein K9L64_06870 [Candidatus Izimaplasma sp.]|nr:hypothetical protein [Candidatus Izimaplasma bacterium]